MNLLKKTMSLCPECYKMIPAEVSEEKGAVYMFKRCPEHGEFKVLMEKDAWIYKQLMNRKAPEKIKPKCFQSMMIAVTHACNLNCGVCYQPDQSVPDLSLSEIKKKIADFAGPEIRFSGGEPTIREDMLEIIQFCCEQNKITTLNTNGVRLGDREYVRKLKESGLSAVTLSLPALDDLAYKQLNGVKLLAMKRRAINNLKQEKMRTILSSYFVKGVNELELKKIYKLYVRNISFIHHLRIRAAVRMGRCEPVQEQLFLSDLINHMAGILRVKKEDLVENSLLIREGAHNTCRVDIGLFPLFLRHLKLVPGRKTSILEKIRILLVLTARFGFKSAVGLTVLRLRGRELPKPFISIRCWYDRFRYDQDEVEYCPSSHLVGETGDVVPLCYGFTMNDRGPHL